MKAVQLSVQLPEEDVRKLAEFVKEQCRLERLAALRDVLEELPHECKEYNGMKWGRFGDGWNDCRMLIRHSIEGMMK